VGVVIREVVQRRVAAGDVAEDQDAVGVRLFEHRAVDRGGVRAPVDVPQEEAVAAAAGDLVHAAQDLRVERVADVPDDHAEERAPAAAQRPGEEVGLVAELGGRGEDPLAGLVADGHPGVATVQDPRYGGDRDAGPLRDVPEGDRSDRLRHAVLRAS
jgi:hypothetical protein